MVHHRWNYNKNNKNISPTKDHQNTAERTGCMVNWRKEMELQYTGKILQNTLVNLNFKNPDSTVINMG